jgi:hypothetical protein
MRAPAAGWAAALLSVAATAWLVLLGVWGVMRVGCDEREGCRKHRCGVVGAVCFSRA